MNMNLVFHTSEDVYEIEYYYEEKRTENKKNLTDKNCKGQGIRTARPCIQFVQFGIVTLCNVNVTCCIKNGVARLLLGYV